MNGWTPAGIFAAGAIVGGAICYCVGAVRQIKQKDKWIKNIVDYLE